MKGLDRLSALLVLGMMVFLFSSGRLWASGGDGDKDPIDLQRETCIEQNPTTVGMVECTVKAMEAWEQELNRVYQELLKRLPPEDQDALRKAQQAWLAWRDAEFRLIEQVYDRQAGTMFVSLMAAEKMKIVRTRVAQLRTLLWLVGE